MSRLVDLALRPTMRSWGRHVLRGLTNVPRPLDDPRVHASGVDADRILMFGSGPAVGWGVLSHDMALPGGLARALSNLTGRGTDIDILAQPENTIANAVRMLRAVDLNRYDAVVLTFGLNEAADFVPVASWRRELDELLDYIATATRSRTPVFVIGVHLISSITRWDSVVAPVAAHHRRSLDRASARSAAHRERVTFIPFEPPPRTEGRRERSQVEYREMGIFIALRMAPVLDADMRSAGIGRRTRGAPVDAGERDAALETAGLVDSETDRRFDRLTEFARRSFHTSAAKITIVDGDRYWTKSSHGIPRLEGPGDDSICFTAVDSEDALVIGDVSLDPRFASMPHVQGPPPVRFYAGYRIEAPNGVPIGVLCVQDSSPRDAAGFDRALLRDLALLVQKEIWVGSPAAEAMGFTRGPIDTTAASEDR